MLMHFFLIREWPLTQVSKKCKMIKHSFIPLLRTACLLDETKLEEETENDVSSSLLTSVTHIKPGQDWGKNSTVKSFLSSLKSLT